MRYGERFLCSLVPWLYNVPNQISQYEVSKLLIHLVWQLIHLPPEAVVYIIEHSTTSCKFDTCY